MPNSKFPQDTTMTEAVLNPIAPAIGTSCYLLIFLMPKGTTERPRGPGQQAIRCFHYLNKE